LKTVGGFPGVAPIRGQINRRVAGQFVKTVNITDGDAQHNTQQGFGGFVPMIRSLVHNKLIF